MKIRGQSGVAVTGGHVQGALVLAQPPSHDLLLFITGSEGSRSSEPITLARRGLPVARGGMV